MFLITSKEIWKIIGGKMGWRGLASFSVWQKCRKYLKVEGRGRSLVRFRRLSKPF
jgi:hypothetical protein